MPQLPKISIIIPSYNRGHLIGKTLQSICEQQYPYLELIVIDGGSTDNTQEVVRSYASCVTTWVSEPDKGIYDAMNKGIDRATGDWLFFIGTDDTLEPGILAQVGPLLVEPYAIVYGHTAYESGDLVISSFRRTFLHNTIHHQSAFYHRRLFDQFRYDLRYKIIADYELNLRIYLDQLPSRYLPQVIARCSRAGASSQHLLSWIETNQVRAGLMPGFFRNCLYAAILTPYYVKSYLSLLAQRLTKRT